MLVREDPDTVVDDTGFVHKPRRIERLVSLVPSETETVFDLRLGHRVVGVTDFCVEPAGRLEEIPRIGGTKNPRVADVLALRPDLVLANREENVERDVLRLREAGVHVHVSYPRTVGGAARLLRDLGTLLRTEEGARAATEVERALEDVRGLTGRPRPRVLVLVWWAPILAVSTDTYISDVVAVCGGTNVVAFAPKNRRYPKLTFDEIVALAPDIVLLPDEPYVFGEDERRRLLELSIPAASAGAIRFCNGKWLSWYGRRTARDLRKIVGLLRMG